MQPEMRISQFAHVWKKMFLEFHLSQEPVVSLNQVFSIYLDIFLKLGKYIDIDIDIYLYFIDMKWMIWKFLEMLMKVLRIHRNF